MLFTVFEPKLVERILLPQDFNNGTHGGGRGPILSGPPRDGAYEIGRSAYTLFLT